MNNLQQIDAMMERVSIKQYVATIRQRHIEKAPKFQVRLSTYPELIDEILVEVGSPTDKEEFTIDTFTIDRWSGVVTTTTQRICEFSKLAATAAWIALNSGGSRIKLTYGQTILSTF